MNGKVCEIILDILAPVSTNQFFGMTSVTLNPLLDAIRRDGRFEWINVRHPESGAFAAGAQAKHTGKLGLCVNTTGKGTLHLIKGLYDAKYNCVPMLVITAYTPTSEQGTTYFQETGFTKMLKEICVYNQHLSTSQLMPHMVQQAVQTALNEGGVAHISIPDNVIGQEVPDFKLYRDVSIPQVTIIPYPGELQKAVDILNKGGKIAILAGYGCHGARAELLALAEILNAPIVHTLRATDVMEYDNPYWVGSLDMLGSPQGINVIDECDTLLILGEDFTYSTFLLVGKNIIQVDSKATHIRRNYVVNVCIIGHVKPAIVGLAKLARKNDNKEFLFKVQNWAATWDKAMDKKVALKGRKLIPPQALTHLACNLADDDAIFTVDAGEVMACVTRYLRIRGEQKLFGSFNHGTPGVAFPTAMGVQVLNKNRQCVALCGNRDFAIMMRDFVTAVRYKLPLTVIVYNNGKFDFVEQEKQAAGFRKYGTKRVNQDFLTYAKVNGGKGITVEKPEDLEDAICIAYAEKEPYILNVKVNPEELIMPPKINLVLAYGYSFTKLKQMFVGDEVQ